MHLSATIALLGASSLAAAGPLGARQAAGSPENVTPIAVCAGPGGPVADPPGAAPRRVVMQAEGLKPGTQRIKLRHGPYLAPGMTKKSIRGEHGALWNCGDDKIEKPCEECTITRTQAGLEYPNGTNANIDTGMWMHHMVAINQGPGRYDPTCYKDSYSLPHFVVGADPKTSERFFASGNERSTIDLSKFTVNGKSAGYHIKPADKFKFIVDLMNMNMDDRVMYLTMTYDIIPGPLPEGYLDTKPSWLDADQCALSEVEVKKDAKSLVIASDPWVPDFEGDLVASGGHLHDGGVTAAIYYDNNAMACDSVAKYAESPEYVYTPVGNMGTEVAKDHISSMKICNAQEMNNLKMNKTQSWTIKGDYDYGKFAGNFEDGKPQDIMAIALVYTAVPPGSENKEAISASEKATAAMKPAGGVDNPGRLGPALQKISDGIKETTKDIEGFNGDVIAATSILEHYEAFTKLLDDTNTFVQSFTPDPMEVVRMLKPSSELLTNTETLMNTLIAKHPAFEAAGLSYIVLDNIQKAMTSATGLTKSMSARVPAKAKRIVDGIVDRIQYEVGRAVKEYGGTDTGYKPDAGSGDGTVAPDAHAEGGMDMGGMEMGGHGHMA